MIWGSWSARLAAAGGEAFCYFLLVVEGGDALPFSLCFLEEGIGNALSDPNSLDPPSTHIHNERLELKDSHEPLRRLGLCTTSDIIIPKKGDMCHEPPSGYFTTYLDYFSNGFSLPPNALLVEIVRSLGVLSLASTFQLREERSRNSESKLHEEIAMLHEELLKKQKESDEKSKSCETSHVELKEKSKSYDVLRQELQQLEERYSVELTTSEHFLYSALGKTLLTSTEEKAVVIDCRRQLRETKLVSEDIVRMIEPSVPEPGDENNEELLGTLDAILGDIDDDEMIEAFRQNPI
ncbi:hypothetical protein F511_27644 [Dorcoceras hygrometricum]|uniref:Uncharacterized protein n=1 Tax=Dorcoceras hygrometricum TaxID=472368 RepID=A0A2Z7BAS1_9LAMI|nr:hypothetical protein F511_27644 [Dorcoceras hygrometricum]